MATTQALTQDEQDTFENIINAPNMALMRGTFHGQEAAIIVSVWEDEDGVTIAPHAVLLRDEDLPFLTASDGEFLPAYRERTGTC